ncbi:GtrA family protein [Oleiagrimonas sp. C23AA]|uniref:GtrA family protein n=1 Tax=Oleiagrimonas sp. C23AA TaxID=2719047 RepID=UPI0014202F62|nr:GtrA family protein [Oleiagrimonas sp. C23AA]NII10509.1 GtrA family protein [Oleiagrimonas sp. C23AA]
MRLKHELGWFFVGGVIGFVVDAGVVQSLVAFADWDPYLARVVSFLCAASATWVFNRSFTFAHRRSGGAASEWGRWLAVMGVGALVNYGTYALVLWLWPLAHHWPVLGVAAGSVVAAGLNFAGARAWVFTGVKTSS